MTQFSVYDTLTKQWCHVIFSMGVSTIYFAKNIPWTYLTAFIHGHVIFFPTDRVTAETRFYYETTVLYDTMFFVSLPKLMSNWSHLKKFLIWNEVIPRSLLYSTHLILDWSSWFRRNIGRRGKGWHFQIRQNGTCGWSAYKFQTT